MLAAHSKRKFPCIEDLVNKLLNDIKTFLRISKWQRNITSVEIVHILKFPVEVGTILLQTNRHLTDSCRTKTRARSVTYRPIHRHPVQNSPALLKTRMTLNKHITRISLIKTHIAASLSV